MFKIPYDFKCEMIVYHQTKKNSHINTLNLASEEIGCKKKYFINYAKYQLFAA